MDVVYVPLPVYGYLPDQNINELMKLDAQKKQLERYLFRIKCRIAFVKSGLKRKIGEQQAKDKQKKVAAKKKRRHRSMVRLGIC